MCYTDNIKYYGGMIMFDLKGYIDRARALNVEDDFLDEDKLFRYQSGEVILYFHTLLLLLPDWNLDVIDVPEGVTRIYFSLTGYVYEKIKNHDYKFIFPSTLEYFGNEDELSRQKLGSIEFKDISFWRFAGSSFKNSIFDFRKCSKLKEICDSSFKGFYFKELYLPDTLEMISLKAFEGALIGKFVAMGVKQICMCAFYNADIKKFIINVDGITLKERSLTFGEPLDKLVLKDIINISYSAFNHIKKLYLPYDVTHYAEYYVDVLRKIADELVKYKTDIHKCHTLLSNLKTDVENSYLKARYKLEESIVAYLETNNVERLVSEVVNLYFYDSKKMKQTIYLYDSSKGFNAIEDRDYECINSEYINSEYVDDNIHIYLERSTF